MGLVYFKFKSKFTEPIDTVKDMLLKHITCLKTAFLKSPLHNASALYPGGLESRSSSQLWLR